MRTTRLPAWAGHTASTAHSKPHPLLLPPCRPCSKALDAQSPEERDDFHLKQLQERLHSANAELREDKRCAPPLSLATPYPYAHLAAS